MATANQKTDVAYLRKIEYLSPAAEVSMTQYYFEIASVEHFWVRRRFEVLRRLADKFIAGAGEMAEIGCGHGLLQRQLEDAYGREVTGFDLNEYALQQNVSRRSKVCCYDILQKETSLQGNFDVIFLFDVLEHIADEDRFLNALQFHMKPQGRLVINVPAGQWAFSRFDEAAGHVRRYTYRALKKTAERNGLQLEKWSYWGLPLLPTLLIRKFWLMRRQDQSATFASGFDSRSAVINSALGTLSRWEWIPQKLLGTSLMAILQKKE
jgi:SAM-dependent methyltransferase